MKTVVPEIRRRRVNRAPVRSDAKYVVYWMIANRRTRFNFAFDLAVDYAAALDRPLLVFEPLRLGYTWASDRFHAFILEGMSANAETLRDSAVAYFPYVERSMDEGKGLLAAVSEHACVVVTDESWGFFQPRMVEAAGRQLRCALEAVDSHGLLPVAAADRVFHRAFDFRRYLQKALPEHLHEAPRQHALKGRVLRPWMGPISPDSKRWPPASKALLEVQTTALRALPIDHDVGVSPSLRGGSQEARQRLRRFIDAGLPRYDEDRNHPDVEGTSGLSAYLHFGHIGPHEILHLIGNEIEWSPAMLESSGSGARSGWWKMPPPHESFLDELVTWRELGANFIEHREDFDRYTSLPSWARRTLAEHGSDPRPETYTFEELQDAQTGDEIWNAAQRQLRSEGRLHNYLRMLWGKKIFEWSSSPERALEWMIELNNRWALDGRDPNSYSGIFWVLGRYDRAWGPERAIFGKIRYMSSENTRKKLRLKAYLSRFGDSRQGWLV